MNFRKIIKKADPYLVAEVGVNHENNLKIAERIIKQAKFGGANAVKFQTYKAEKIAAKNSPYYWDLKQVSVKSQFKLFKKYDKFKKEDYIKLKRMCDFYNVEFLSTPFDINSALFLNKLVRFFKIASADLTNLMLIDTVCKIGKPIILSTGASKIQEIKYINNYINKKFPKIELALLHCVLSYPTKDEDAHLELIGFLKKKFKSRLIGYSDHTMPDSHGIVLLEAYKKGAQIIEKHFTLDKFKGKKNNDHFHSMDFNDFKIFRKNVSLLKKINGKFSSRTLLKCEKKPKKNARRSLFALGNLKKNQTITEKNLIAKRPGDGISPLFYKKILGKKVKKNLNDEHKFIWKDFK